MTYKEKKLQEFDEIFDRGFYTGLHNADLLELPLKQELKDFISHAIEEAQREVAIDIHREVISTIFEVNQLEHAFSSDAAEEYGFSKAVVKAVSRLNKLLDYVETYLTQQSLDGGEE